MNKIKLRNRRCNNFSESYELENNIEIKFSKVISKRIACPNMELETRFMKLWKPVKSYKLSPNPLFL
ncbi:MAG: META domain-containing protein [Ignavibacteriae bacterium]|nr:META domain-containing protein [Ignavibacteriota bacterium]